MSLRQSVHGMIFCAHGRSLLGHLARAWLFEPQAEHFSGLQAMHLPGPKANLTLSPFGVHVSSLS